MPDEPEPWYRTSGAIFAAGGLGLILVVALVTAVVQMSDQWMTVPTSTTIAPPTVATTTATARSEEPTTTPNTSTSYSPPASLSTADINPSIAPPPHHLGDLDLGNHIRQ